MRRQGNLAIHFALSLTVLVAIAAMTVDLAALRVWQQQLHNAAEAAAHAGAAQLDGTAEGLAAARAAAYEVGALNTTAGDPVLLAAEDVQLGRAAGRAFVADASDPAVVDAVRVRAHREDLDAFFARVAFLREHLAAADEAVAVAGGPTRDDCPLPIAVPSCELAEVAATCDHDVVFNGAGDDNAGWALPGAASPSAATVQASLTTCAPADTSDTVSMMNGAVTPAARALAELVAAQETRWDPAWGPLPPRSPRSGVPADRYGRVLWRRVMVFEDPSRCANPRFNGAGTDLTGFATAVVYDVETSGPVETRNVRMRVVCDQAAEPGGGGSYGTRAPPRMLLL